MTKLVRKYSSDDLKFEYGLDCTRMTPWDGINPPFGGAYCVVKANTKSLEHVNEPADEEEMFICISGTATVFIGTESFAAEKGDLFVMPKGMSHYVLNETGEDFHYYALWWNRGLADSYIAGNDA